MSGLYSTHPDYQDTGLAWLGRIPKSWELRRLGSYFRERRAKVSDAEFPALSVTMQGIVPQLETAAKTNDGDNRKLVRAGDFVINSRSDRKGSSGVSPFDGSVSLISIVLEPVGIYPPFAHHLLRSRAFQEEFYRFGKGIVADLWSTNYSSMKNIGIPVMPLSEQTQIAKFLDYETLRIDALIEKQQQLIALLKEKRQAVISHAVTKGLNPDAPMRDSGVEWLGEVPKHWDVRPLKRLGTIKYGIGEPPEYRDRGTPLIRATNVRSGTITPVGLVLVDPSDIPAKRIFWLQAGDIVVVRSGAGTGDSAIMPSDYGPAIAGFDMVLRCEKANARFVQYALLSSYLRQGQIDLEKMRAAQPHLNAEELGECDVILPPLEEQIQTAKLLDSEMAKIDALVEKAGEVVLLLQERRTALISAAVTGKIDVRGWKAPEPQTHPEGA